MTTPIQSPETSEPTFRVMPLVAVKATGVKLGIVAGLGVSTLAGWQMGGLLPGLLAGIVWSLSAAFGVLVILLVSQRQSSRLGVAWLAGSTVRLLAALTLGLFSFLVLKPEGKVFWACFLLAGLCCLVFETVWAVRQLNAVRRPVTPAISTGVS